MRLNINLATRAYVDARKVNVSLLVGIIVLVVVFIFGIRQFSVNFGQIRKLNVGLQHDAPSQPTVSTGEYQAVLARIKVTNDIIDQKTFNWLGLLNRLETVVPDGVALTSVAPDIGKNELSLSGAARKFNDLRRFMESLEDSKLFTNVYLLGHGVAKSEDGSGITFNISCQVDFKKI